MTVTAYLLSDLTESIFPLVMISRNGGAWVAQLVECPASAQVVISRSVSSSPMLGSVRTARSLEPALDSVSPSPSLLLPHWRALSRALSQKINKH